VSFVKPGEKWQRIKRRGGDGIRKGSGRVAAPRGEHFVMSMKAIANHTKPKRGVKNNRDMK